MFQLFQANTPDDPKGDVVKDDVVKDDVVKDNDVKDDDVKDDDVKDDDVKDDDVKDDDVKDDDVVKDDGPLGDDSEKNESPDSDSVIPPDEDRTAEDNSDPDTPELQDGSANDNMPSDGLILVGVDSGTAADMLGNLVDEAMENCLSPEAALLSEGNSQGQFSQAGLITIGGKLFTESKVPGTGFRELEEVNGSECSVTDASGGVMAVGAGCKSTTTKDPATGAIIIAAGSKDHSGNANAVCVRIQKDGTKTVQGVTIDPKSRTLNKSEPHTFPANQPIDNKSAGLDDFFSKDPNGVPSASVRFDASTTSSKQDQPQKKSAPTTLPRTSPSQPTTSQPENSKPQTANTSPESSQPQDPKSVPAKLPEDPKSPSSPGGSQQNPESRDPTRQPESPSQSSPSPESQPTPGQGAPAPGGGPGLDDLIPFLDAIGFFPGPVGYAAQASLAGIYIYQGKYSEALTAGIGAIPIAGVLSKLQKVGNTAKAVDKAAKHKKFLDKLAISQKGPVKSEASANQALAKMAKKNVSKKFSSEKKTKDAAQHSKGKSQQMRGRKKNKKEAHGKTKPGKDAFDTKKGGHYHDKDHTNDPDYKAHKKNVHYRWY